MTQDLSKFKSCNCNFKSVSLSYTYVPLNISLPSKILSLNDFSVVKIVNKSVFSLWYCNKDSILML